MNVLLTGATGSLGPHLVVELLRAKEIELLKVSLDHAQPWMTLHADQRLRALQFWLIAVGSVVLAVRGRTRGPLPRRSCRCCFRYDS